jgi:hypothetical protein
VARTIHVEARLDAALRTPDPVVRYRQLQEVRADVDDLGRRIRAGRQGCARALKDEGRTWDEVGALLGLSLQGAEQLARTGTTRSATR